MKPFFYSQYKSINLYSSYVSYLIIKYFVWQKPNLKLFEWKGQIICVSVECEPSMNEQRLFVEFHLPGEFALTELLGT